MYIHIDVGMCSFIHIYAYMDKDGADGTEQLQTVRENSRGAIYGHRYIDI